MIDKDKKNSKYEDDLDELEENLKKRSRFDDDDDDIEDEPKKKDEDSKDLAKKDEVKSKEPEKKKSELESNKKKEDPEEKDLFGTKVVIGIVVLAIMGILLFTLFSGGGDSASDSFTVTFADGATTSEIIVRRDGTVMRPADPTREGYVFIGWFLNGQPFDFNTRVTSDLRLEARWLSIEEAMVSGVTLEPEEIILAPGGTQTLTMTIQPTTALDKSVRWQSSNPDVATVDATGRVTAVAVGTATITVTTTDGGHTATATVTVLADAVQVTGVTMRETLDVGVNETLQLTATVQPGNATNRSLTWSSSDSSIARVDANGRVTGVRDGTAVITVRTNDGGFEARTTVTVRTIPLTGITVTGGPNVTVGLTITLTARFTPTNASNRNVTWSSDNTAIATVNQQGVVTGVAVGTTIIRATGAGGVVGTISITVQNPPPVVVNWTFTQTPRLAGETVDLYTLTVRRNGVPQAGVTINLAGGAVTDVNGQVTFPPTRFDPAVNKTFSGTFDGAPITVTCQNC
jgi:uncharacterized repeat protein (TIGR02543 family)